MKVVHINTKDIEKERAYLEEGRAIIRAQAQREYHSYLKREAKRIAKEEANKKAR